MMEALIPRNGLVGRAISWWDLSPAILIAHLAGSLLSEPVLVAMVVILLRLVFREGGGDGGRGEGRGHFVKTSITTQKTDNSDQGIGH